MFISEVMDLLEILRGLFERKAELDKEYFDNFIEPIWTSFTKVHEDYKTTFRGYTEFVSQDAFDARLLIDRMRRDSIYSEDMRSELRALLKSILGVIGHKNDHDLRNFAWYYKNHNDKYGLFVAFLCSIGWYFNLQSGVSTADGADSENNQYIEPSSPAFMVNRARYRAIIYLSRQSNAVEATRILRLLDNLMQNLQYNFEKTAEMYYALRQSYYI